MLDQTLNELLSAYLDGELSPVEHAEMERRLEDSLELQEQLAGLTEVSRQVKMLPRPYAPPELRVQVMDRVHQAPVMSVVPIHHPAVRILKRTAAWSSVAVAASLLILAGWSLQENPREHPHLVMNSDRQLEKAESAGTKSLELPAALGLDPTEQTPRTQVRPQPMSISPSTEPVRIVSVSRDEIRRRIDELDVKPQQGNTIRVPGHLREKTGETPIVVVFTVVDVLEAMNQMQVLVQEQQIRSRDNRSLMLDRSQTGDSLLTAVTVELEMNGPEMAAVLNNVPAVAAVMYVEGTSSVQKPIVPALRNAEIAKPEKEALSQDSHQAATTRPMALNDEPTIRSAGERRFNFQSLAQQAPSAPPEENSSLGFALKQNDGAANSSVSPPADPRHRAGSEKTLRAPMARSIAERSANQDSRSGPSSSVSEMPSPPGVSQPGWEEARRFRAFILLKQQPSSSQKPAVESQRR